MNQSLCYENFVRLLIISVSKDYPNIVVKRKQGQGSFSSHDVDLSIQVNNKIHNIEIKQDSHAQMGSISINYRDGQFSIKNSEHFDLETIDLILQCVNEKKDVIDKALLFFKENDPIYHHNKYEGFPLRVSTDAWKKAVDGSIVKELNDSIKHSTSFINSYYKSKDVNYMQIGGAGLFHLDQNPLKLDIPKLDGEIHIEFRASKSGSKYNKTHDYEYSTVILRLQGRLLFKGVSPLSLDKESDVKKVFDQIGV